MWNRQEYPSYSRAVALLVFFPRSTRTRIVAPHFRSCANRFRRFRLRWPGLILQIFLLALLAAFDFAGHGGQLLRLAGTPPRACARGRGPFPQRAPSPPPSPSPPPPPP